MKSVLKAEDFPSGKQFCVLVYEQENEFIPAYDKNSTNSTYGVTRTYVYVTKDEKELNKYIITLINNKKHYVLLDVNDKLEHELVVDIKIKPKTRG